MNAKQRHSFKLAGDLHWKQVSFYVNSDFKVIAMMKGKLVWGTFTKKKKFSGVCREIPAWHGRQKDKHREQKEYFGVLTLHRVVEFECRNKGEKQMWVEGIQQILDWKHVIRCTYSYVESLLENFVGHINLDLQNEMNLQ